MLSELPFDPHALRDISIEVIKMNTTSLFIVSFQKSVFLINLVWVNSANLEITKIFL
jgi:hypothetical protein